jgi:hypothetical protein
MPKGEDDIWVTFIDRTKYVIGNKSRHLINEPGAFAESLLECVGVFLLDVNTISDSYHANLPLANDTPGANDLLFRVERNR